MATPVPIPLLRPRDPDEVVPYKAAIVLSSGFIGIPIPNATIFLNCENIDERDGL